MHAQATAPLHTRAWKTRSNSSRDPFSWRTPCTGTGLTPTHICTGTGLTPAYIRTGSGLTPTHVFAGSGLTPATCAPGLTGRTHLREAEKRSDLVVRADRMDQLCMQYPAGYY